MLLQSEKRAYQRKADVLRLQDIPYYLVDKDRSLWGGGGELPQRVPKKYIVCMGVTVLMS